MAVPLPTAAAIRERVSGACARRVSGAFSTACRTATIPYRTVYFESSWRRRRSTVRNSTGGSAPLRRRSTFRIFTDLYVAAAPNLSTLRHAPVRCSTRLHEIVGIGTKQYEIVRNPYFGKKWRPLGGSPMAIYISGVEKSCNHNSDFSSPVLHFASSLVLSLSVQTWLSLQVNRSRPSCV